MNIVMKLNPALVPGTSRCALRVGKQSCVRSLHSYELMFPLLQYVICAPTSHLVYRREQSAVLVRVLLHWPTERTPSAIN